MITYKSELNLKDALAQVDSILGTIEVKGDSVLQLYNSRMVLKKVFESIEVEETKDENTKEE